MKKLLCASLLGLAMLAGCSGTGGNQSALPSSTAAIPSTSGAAGEAKPLSELVNLDYSNGSITVYSIQKHTAKVAATFTPGNASGGAQGLAMDKLGLIYTTVTSSGSSCAACVDVYTSAGQLKTQLPAPKISGAPGAPSLSDVSVDLHQNVYVSDYGQQAVYYFPDGNKGGKQAKIVVQNSQNAASVLATPDGKNVVVSGGCGFYSARPFTRTASGFTEGTCFGIGTLGLITGAIDNLEDVIEPVDGFPSMVSIGSPSGGSDFRTPGKTSSISGVALNSSASIAYVANASKGYIYAFARPQGGWLTGTQPKLVATYKGFKGLDVIAIPQ